MLLTRPPLTASVALRGPLDLHVLGTPPAFVLSQDQTLQLIRNSTRPAPASRPERSKGLHTSSVSQ